jgi:hypothetical protein
MVPDRARSEHLSVALTSSYDRGGQVEKGWTDAARLVRLRKRCARINEGGVRPRGGWEEAALVFFSLGSQVRPLEEGSVEAQEILAHRGRTNRLLGAPSQRSMC